MICLAGAVLAGQHDEWIEHTGQPRCHSAGSHQIAHGHIRGTLVFYSLAPPTRGTGGAPEAGGRRPRPWQLAVEIVRSLLVAVLVAGLLTVAGWDGAVDGLLLGLSLTVLPIVLLAGSVLWEGVPARAAATHALDWIIKLVAIGAIVGAFA